MKILVTGGTGRIGSNLVKQLLEKGHDIRSFVYPDDVNRVGRWDGTERVETVLAICGNTKMLKKPLKVLMPSIISPLPSVVRLITASIWQSTAWEPSTFWSVSVS